MAQLLPVSGLIPTRNRRVPLERVFRSLAEQSAQPVEIVVVDASASSETEELCRMNIPGLESRILYHKAHVAGAVEQRNQAMSYVTEDAILFLDDDIYFEPECIIRLWQALNSDARIGGVNAMITNQRYLPPGRASRTLFRILYGQRLDSYAGKCIGPAVNLLPEDREDLPEVMEVEWLNTTCTLYRRAALPEPPFISHELKDGLRIPAFPQEDLALSLRVREHWKLANARTARIYHDSQPGIHKANISAAAKIELINRHYLMTSLLGRRRLSDQFKLLLLEVFGNLTALKSSRQWKELPFVIGGKLKALPVLLTVRYPPEPSIKKAERSVKPAAVQATLLPISALVPTLNRRAPLGRMLDSLAQQSAQPAEMIVVDASASDDTKRLCETAEIPGLLTKIIYRRAIETGAAVQRQQAIAAATQATVWFLDDDVIFEEDCLKHLWEALDGNAQLGGVNAMITNQRYFPPGRVSRTVFQLLHGSPEDTFAGKCIGPALNLLPEDDERLPDCVPVEWLNTTCTLYRRAALPEPLFPAHFKGYSYLEDVALSLVVGRKWRLGNARRARIFHDTQPGTYKSSAFAMAKMELVNRHYVMTQVLGRRGLSDYAKLAFLETFIAASRLVSVRGWVSLPATLLGKLTAIPAVITKSTRSSVSPSST
jgi:glycosyltransferase involved in cell wall biosynthesis